MTAAAYRRHLSHRLAAPRTSIRPAARLPAALRRTLALPAYAEDTPERAGLSVGIAYGLWGLDTLMTDRLTEVTYHLTGYVQDHSRTHRLLITATLSADQATVSVIALSGRLTTPAADPATVPRIAELADATGRTAPLAGPCLYATVNRPQELART